MVTSHERSQRSMFISSSNPDFSERSESDYKCDVAVLSCGLYPKLEGVRNQKDLSTDLALVKVDRTVVRHSFLTAPTTVSKHICIQYFVGYVVIMEIVMKPYKAEI